ncbi:hypothetical protein E1301_Tti009789 [Triplophysa tibetana]|uniref:Uncharacterized protein n=1 Tax=Triplophysa tibetana TaxID=1572043 RepID=A0A5A9N8N9_9TELE|nr:hypothetical protein E1301_Tti009789 [Triplophysa tibetana]
MEEDYRKQLPPAYSDIITQQQTSNTQQSYSADKKQGGGGCMRCCGSTKRCLMSAECGRCLNIASVVAMCGMCIRMFVFDCVRAFRERARLLVQMKPGKLDDWFAPRPESKAKRLRSYSSRETLSTLLSTPLNSLLFPSRSPLFLRPEQVEWGCTEAALRVGYGAMAQAVSLLGYSDERVCQSSDNCSLRGAERSINQSESAAPRLPFQQHTFTLPQRPRATQTGALRRSRRT